VSFVVDFPESVKNNNNVGKIEDSYIFDVGQKWAIAFGPICFWLFLLTLNDLYEETPSPGKPVAIKHAYESCSPG
jgi:hypothetical protein